MDKPPDELDDAARNGQPCRHVRCVAGELSLCGHLPKDFVEKERVAFRHIVQPAYQQAVGRDSPGGLNELADAAFVEAEQRERRALALDLGD